MSVIGFIFAMLSALVLLLTIIPLLGWINWLNIPFAFLGLIFSAIGIDLIDELFLISEFSHLANN